MPVKRKTQIKRPDRAIAMKGNTYSVGNKGGLGRISYYQPEVNALMIEYFNREPYTIIVDKKGKPQENKYGKPIMIPAIFPTMEGFAIDVCGVHPDTVRAWANAKDKVSGELLNKDFNQVYYICRRIQKKLLIENGLAGNYVPQVVKFIAINLTDMVDEKKIQHSGDKDNPIVTKAVGGMTPNEIDEYLKTKISS